MGKYVEDFDAFLVEAESLFRKDPLASRFVTKYVHKKGKMVLKVTNDSEVRAHPVVPSRRHLQSFPPSFRSTVRPV